MKTSQIMRHATSKSGSSISARVTKGHDSSNATSNSNGFEKTNFTVQVSFAQGMTILLVCTVSGFYFGQGIQSSMNQRNWKLESWYDATSKLETAIDEGNLHFATFTDVISELSDRDFLVPRTKMGSPFIQLDTISVGNFINWTKMVVDSNTLQENSTLSKLSNSPNEDAGDVSKAVFQQLLVEFRHISRSFLESKDALASSMVELAKRSDLTLKSYHCQELIPTGGVSCLGILAKGHISLQTWPKHGLMTLDTFAPGVYSLITTVSIVNELFGIKEEFGSENVPHIVWNHKRRGRHEFIDGDVNPEESDFGFMLESMAVVKDFVASVQTDFQRIDFYDILQPSYRSLNDKDRVVYMDGVMQSRQQGEAAYHEALVHPAMFAHDMPKRVAIIGGGEGATLREVLKHNTVEKVVMIEIDELMVKASRKYLPEWSDCSDMTSAKSNCFDDPRAEIIYSDAIQWFIQRFGAESGMRPEDTFDVVILDALDPNSAVEFSDFLYDNDNFTEAISNALGDNGVLVAQIGESDHSYDVPSQYEDNNANIFIDALLIEGFQSINIYTEAHGRYDAPWKYFVGMKDRSSKSNWMKSEAEINTAMRQRTVSTVSGSSPFRYFDGATMKGYEFPDRVLEDKYCGQFPEWCKNGHGYDPEIPNVARSSFEVDYSKIAKGGRGVFAKDFVKKGSYIGLEECVHGMFIPSTTYDLMERSADHFRHSDFLQCLANGYVDGYGWTDNEYGDSCAGVDPGIFTFVNHGCNGSYNVGVALNETEATMKIGGVGARGLYERSLDGYYPFGERHFPLWYCDDFKALHDIESGEEIFDNYLVFGGEEGWDANLQELQDLCSGKTGSVSLYEQGVLEKLDS